MSKLFNANFRPLVKKIERDFDCWSTLPLSLARRINLIKMVVMPKFLYLFQHIPVYITKSFFDKLDGTISKFLWGNKPARIRKAILQSPKSDGGLALLNLRRYYWAANVQKILHWLDDTCDSPPAWAHLEKETSHLRSAICSQLPLPLSSLRANPIVSASLKRWSQLRKNLGLQSPSILSPLFKNHHYHGPHSKFGKVKVSSVLKTFTQMAFFVFHRALIKLTCQAPTFFVFSKLETLSKRTFLTSPIGPLKLCWTPY